MANNDKTWLEEHLGRILQIPEQIKNMPVEYYTVKKPNECPFPGRLCSSCEKGKRSSVFHKDNIVKEYDVTACYATIRFQKLISDSNISGIQLRETFENAKVDNYNNKLLTFLQEWDYKTGQGIYITAGKSKNNPQGNGTGKSYALNALANRLCKEGVGCYIAKTITFLNELKSTYDADSSESEINVLNKYINKPVLLWDDIGKESFRHDTSWVPEKIYYVIDERIKRNKPIVISSNFELEELEKHFGELNHGPAIVSRLVQHCKLNYFVLGGPDRRI